MGTLLIAKDNIKKKKGNAFILFLLVSLAVLLLYVGISVLSNMGNVIDSRNIATNGADYFLLTPSKYPDQIEDILKNSKDVKYLEKERALSASGVKFYNGKDAAGNAHQLDFIFLDKEAERRLSQIDLTDKGNKWKDDSIILPYYMKVGMGYKAGDTLNLIYKDKTIKFEIYGFTEDIMFSTPTNISAEKCYISTAYFENKMKELGTKATVFRADLTEGCNTDKFEEDIGQTLNSKISDYQYMNSLSLNYDTMKYGTGVTANIFMGVLTAFAVLLILIALIIVHFNVNNSIESNIKNIGMLEASGYTSRQLWASDIMEFLIISIYGSSAGLLAANAAAKAVGGMISSSIGLRWHMGFDLKSAAISSVLVIVSVILAVMMSSSKYKKIAPLDALRSGIHGHNFKKNYIKLDKAKLPLNFSIGLKNILYNIKKNTAVFLIMVLLSFSANEAVCIYQNFALNQDKMIQITGFEVPDTVVTVINNDKQNLASNMDDIKQKVKSLTNVNQILEYTAYDMVCKNGEKEETVNCDVYDKPGSLVVDNVVEGRRPKYDNEIMLTSLMAEKLDVKLGDVVYLEMNGKSQNYLLTGISQGINHLGKKAMITKEGIKRLNGEIILNSLYIYANNGSNIKSVFNEVKSVLSDKNSEVMNYQEYVSSTMNSIVTVMKTLCLVMLITVILVLAMVLVLLIQSQLVRDKKTLGIYKALGYTTGQLIMQTIMSYIPIVFAGTLAGCIAAWFGINPSFILCLTAFGIKKCSMNISLSYMLGILVLISLWAELIAVICSAKIRKIVPCEMIQEM